MNRYRISEFNNRDNIIAIVIASDYLRALELVGMSIHDENTWGDILEKNVRSREVVEYHRPNIKFDYRKIKPGMVVRFTDENTIGARIVTVMESNVNGFKWGCGTPCGFSFRGWKSIDSLEILHAEPVALNF